MKLSVRSIALTLGLLWGGCLLVVGIVNLFVPAYGGEFLRVMSSVYPGLHDSRTWASALLGTLYGFIDGVVGGWVFAGLYDWISRNNRRTA